MENLEFKQKITIKDLFPYKSYMILLIANFVSRFGDSLDSIAYGWMVYTLTGSKLLMGTIFAVNAVPNIIFSPFAGTIVDRLKKKNLIIIGYIGRGIVVSITAFMFMIGTLEPWHLFLFTFMNSTFETITGPANSALTQLMLPNKLFLTGNSFSSSAYKFAELIGAGSAGIIISVFKIYGAIFIDAATFFISSFIMLFLKVQNDNKKDDPITVKSYFSELKSGFLFISKQKLILIIMSIFAIINFCLSPLNIFMPILVKDTLKGGPEILSLLSIALTIGTILGGLIIGQFGSRFKISGLIVFSLTLLGLNYALLYLPGNILYGTSSVLVTTVSFAFMGFALPASSSPIGAYIMTNTPKELMGRVSSVLTMINFSAMPLGSAVAGAISQYVSISIQFLVMGIIIVCLSVLVYLNKDFRKV